MLRETVAQVKVEPRLDVAPSVRIADLWFRALRWSVTTASVIQPVGARGIGNSQEDRLRRVLTNPGNTTVSGSESA
jgi:hypothetical protein